MSCGKVKQQNLVGAGNRAGRVGVQGLGSRACGEHRRIALQWYHQVWGWWGAWARLVGATAAELESQD